MTAARWVFVMFVAALVMRMLQLTNAVVHRGEAWWYLEASRWCLHVGCALVAVTAVTRMFRELADHRERIAKIEESVRWARLELDISEFRDYADRV